MNGFSLEEGVSIWNYFRFCVAVMLCWLSMVFVIGSEVGSDNDHSKFCLLKCFWRASTQRQVSSSFAVTWVIKGFWSLPSSSRILLPTWGTAYWWAIMPPPLMGVCALLLIWRHTNWALAELLLEHSDIGDEWTRCVPQRLVLSISEWPSELINKIWVIQRSSCDVLQKELFTILSQSIFCVLTCWKATGQKGHDSQAPGLREWKRQENSGFKTSFRCVGVAEYSSAE